MRRYHFLLAGFTLALVTMLLVFVFKFNRKGYLYASRSDKARVSVVYQPPRPCWIFNHLNKGGGSTVKYMLWPWMAKYNISSGLYDSAQWKSGPEFARQFLQEKYTITWGAYTEGLRPYGGQDCKWFTIFRHPVDRLVSAYFYCKKSPVDGMCATVAVSANEVDLVTFARHWGNFGLRQFLYGDVAVSAPVASKFDDAREEDGKPFPGWWNMKRYLERLAVNTSAVAAAAARGGEHLTSIEHPVLKTFLAQVKDRLNDRYAAVGILEDWPTTLHLFNEVLRLPHFDWVNAPHVGKKNSNHAFLKEAEDALRSARGDPDIHDFIWLDILLYEHAREIHVKQVEEYGVGSD